MGASLFYCPQHLPDMDTKLRTQKNRPEGRFFRCWMLNYLAADAADEAAAAASEAAEAALEAAAAASVAAEAAASAAGAGAASTTGAGAGVSTTGAGAGASSFLLQAARATTIREAISRDFFICFP
nr:hypothetical protein [Janthinobacterium sp.]